MKNILLLTFLSLLTFDLKAKIIYVEPVINAKYVKIHNNIVIGFDEKIESTNLNSVMYVRGKVSGVHSGEIIISADKKKLIFKPYKPFAFNEMVEVRLNNLKTSFNQNNRLAYSFQTQATEPNWDFRKSLYSEIGNSDLSGLTNSTDSLPLITVSVSNNPSPGDLYLSNFPFTNIPNTPYLLNVRNDGTFSYYRQVQRFWALDYKKQPNGLVSYYEGVKYYGEDIQHNRIDSFECGNGYSTDHHELQIASNGHAFLMSYDPQKIDMSQIVPGGHPNATVIGLIIQELDENKNVVFQWRSWDHIAITDAIHEDLTDSTVDYVHGNAIEFDNDGNILISSRHLSEITKISRTTGDIIWRLGGVHNDFTFINDSIGFSYQHDIRRISNGNITLFDNGNFHTPPFSRAVEYQLDEINKIATLVWQYRSNPEIYSFAMGSVQRLRNGNTLISWGAANPTLKEVTPGGNVALEMSLPLNIYTYRTLRDEVNLNLNMKIAIEGFYNTQTTTLNTKDAITAYLRRTTSPYNIIDSSKSVVDSVSFIGNFRFYNFATGTYYISTSHRNGLETWSKAGGENFVFGNVYQYDFTDSDAKAYGNNLILKGSKYCIYSGDVNRDGVIDGTDLELIDNDAFNFNVGYEATDLTGDNFVDGEDIMVGDNNALNFISVMRP